MEKKFFQDVIIGLTEFWAQYGVVIGQPFDIEVGAGTFHPLTFFRCLGPLPWKTAYVQPSRRPTDGRFANNPLRTQRYYQFQVLLKPAPEDIQELYKKSLMHVGIGLAKHDLRFVHDDWESPTLGATGLGWEVWLDTLEVTQFTYFQQMAGRELDPISVEITYGLERIAMFISGRKNAFELDWAEGVTYADMHKKEEEQFCSYNFEYSNVDMLKRHFNDFEAEAIRLVKAGLYLPAYEFVAKASHCFNLIDARGAISGGERPNIIAKIRNLAKLCATAYLEDVNDSE